MTEVIFPNQIPDGTPASDDRILFSDTSDGEATKDCAISDLPISTDTQTALDTKQDTSEKGQINGYASLDGTGKVPASQLPAGTGTGDMLKSIYDPNNKEKEVAFKDEVASGVGGYTANIYFTTLASSTNPAYKQISYTPEVAETIISDSVTAGEKLLTTYIYDLDYGSSIIDAGEWVFNLYGNCSPTAGLSTFRFEVFTRDNLGIETNLFDVSSGDISGINERITIYSTQPTYNVNATDRVGVRVYINTTHNSTVTFNFKVGNGEASYFFAPIAIRHNLLRARDALDAHPISSITGLQTELDGKANLSGATFTGGVTATNLSGTNTGDETAASIKTKYESNSNTNAFTDSEKSKLAGIESGAEVNEVTLSGNESLTNKVINGVGITSSGDGNSYLANDGSYKTISTGGGGFLREVSVNGTQYVNNILFEGAIGKATTLTAGYITLLTAPTGANFIITIYKSTDSGATYPTSETVTLTAGSKYEKTALTTAFAEGDWMKATITQIGSTIAGQDLLFSITGS